MTTTETARFNWPIPEWNADWQKWQEKFLALMDNVDATTFGTMSNMQLVMKQLPNVTSVFSGGVWRLSMSADAIFVSRTLLTDVRLAAETLDLTANSVLGIAITPGSVGAQNVSWEVFTQGIDIAPEIVPLGYVDESFNVIWYNGSILTAGATAQMFFMTGGGLGGNMDSAYNAFGSGPAIVTIDDLQGQGDLRFRPTGDVSFIVDMAACTNSSDGFSVINGTDQFDLIRTGSNDMDLDADLGEFNIAALDSSFIGATGASADLSIGARGQTITLNQAGDTALDAAYGAAGATSIVGAFNVLVSGPGVLTDLNEAYDNFGASPATVAINNAEGQGSLTWETYTTHRFIVDISNSNNLIINGAATLFGFAVENGTDYFWLGKTDTDQMSLLSDLYSVTIDTESIIELDSGTSFFISGNSASSLSVTGGNLTVSILTSGSLILDSVGLVDINAGANLDVDVTGTIAIDGSGTIEWSGTNASLTNAGALSLANDITLTGGGTIGSTLNGNIVINPNGTGNVGVGNITPSYDFSIGSADGSDQIGIYHDNTDAYFTTTDGKFIFLTDEGTDTTTDVQIKGKGTEGGIIRTFDGSDINSTTLYNTSGIGHLGVLGVSAVSLNLQHNGDVPINCFANAADGETPELNIYGFRTSDARRSLQIGVGVDAADTASFDGLSNYLFDGKIIINSTDSSDQIGIYHDNTDAYFTTADGDFIFQTDEGTNTVTRFLVRGKGTGIGTVRVYDEDDAEYVILSSAAGLGYLNTAGSSPGKLMLQDTAHAGVAIFENAAEGETEEVTIHGYRAADANRSLEIGVGVDAADTASFDGLSNYLFDGKIIINSTDSSDQIGIYHDNANAYFTTTDGVFIFQTDEGTDTDSLVDVRGKGTGIGYLRIFDEDNLEYLTMYSVSGIGVITTSGSSPGDLLFQVGAHADVDFFQNAASGDTRELKIHGYRTADANRSLEIGVGINAADTASFDGLSNYLFDGKIIINSTDSSDQIGIYHDNTDAYFTTNDGSFIFQTDEGTNTPTSLDVRGKGTGLGYLRLYDEGKADRIELYCSNNVGYIETVGATPAFLSLQFTAHSDIFCFAGAASGETPEFSIYGYRSGDALRQLQIGVGVDAINTASFDGVDNYLFDGTVSVTGGLKAETSLWYHYRQISALDVSGGASGATFIPPDSNTLGGYQLDAVTEYLYFGADVHNDWDAASNIIVEVYFEVNVNNTGGGTGDTVDLQLLCYMKGDGETVTKLQTIEEATIVGQSAQYNQFHAEFEIIYNDGSNPVQIDDILGMRINLETDTSEVDDIIVNHFEFKYKSNKPNAIEV